MPQTTTFKNFIRGLIPTSGIMSQPKGSVPRSSNLLETRRGSLRTCDGSMVVHAFQGAIQSGRGRIMASFFYQPIGVSARYMLLAKAFDQLLGPPQNLTVVTAGGGSLAASTYYYKVTALDGIGGETTASAEVSIVTGVNGKNTLTWNIVPNAIAYNIFRSNTGSGGSGAEQVIVASNTPVLQPAYGTITQSYVDDGRTNMAQVAVTSMSFSSATGLATFILSDPNAFFATLNTGSVTLQYTGGTNYATTNWTVAAVIDVINGVSTVVFTPSGFVPTTGTSTGGNLTVIGPPLSDTTQQTVLYRCPVIPGLLPTFPVGYGSTFFDLVGLYPADNLIIPAGEGGGGGGGGRGGTGGSGASGKGTPSGGIAGNTSNIPQIVEFTNQLVIALGNGFPPVVYSDPNSPDHTATSVFLASIAADAFGVVTVTTVSSHGIPTNVNPGSCCLIANVTPTAYNGSFAIMQVVSNTVFKVRNLAAAGLGAGSGATMATTITTIPLTSSFTAAFPSWSASTAYGLNSVVQPTAPNGHFYKCIQAGTSGTAQPTFPTGTGQRVYDAGVIWQEAGTSVSAAPPPPGAGHIGVYSGALWVWNTSPTNTAGGLDGPCSLRMSDINNLGSWNPINQAFLDKDDGTEGMGLSAFTITAQGIPPQGSLVAFKNFSTYQILGLFGAPNFAIQRVKTDMGATSPRTLQYVPGFGICRFTHLGVGVFDGVDDRVISEEVRPYLFPSNDSDVTDITVMDANYSAVAWAAQTASPPLYALAIPIGASLGKLTRLLCYDLVLKCWASVDLPFPISHIAQFRTTIANPVTVMGGFSDGCLSRWQAGDITWDTFGSGARSPSVVAWSVRTPTLASNDTDQRIYVRRLNIRGINTNSVAGIGVTVRLDGVGQPAYTSPAVATGDFEVEAGIGRTILRAEADITGSGDVEIFSFGYGIVAKPAGVPAALCYG